MSRVSEARELLAAEISEPLARLAALEFAPPVPYGSAIAAIESALRQSRAAAVDDEQTVERVAKAVRFDRFERTGRGKAYDPALPLHETELADARAALRALAHRPTGSQPNLSGGE